MKMVGNIPVWGAHESKTLRQIETCAATADRAALMADGHLGYAVPIGGVVAYKNAISPSGVGFDIACGNKAVRVDMPGSELRARVAKIMDDVWSTISFGVGRKNAEKVEHAIFEPNHPGWDLESAQPLRQKAQNQLGTVGSGNHYVDLFTDEQDRVWIGVHFGSRGFGHGIATWFLKAAGAKDGMEVEPCVIGTDTDLGEQYIRTMTLAGEYAYAGRDWVCDKVTSILGAPIVESVHNHHNFAWREEHGGEQYWVVRKGATPAFPGQKGFVGGTMAEPAVILEGVDSEESRTALYSTVHGAGRVMGRREAAGVFHRKSGEMIRPPKITQAMMRQKVRQANVELRGAGVDESPHCYKRLNEVLEAHGETIRILHTLTPVGVAMAGADEFDPYKD
ncbi:RtcB family protein [Acidicapsa dinghuensis]|uniref:3'-phosphate/5'-hydroxy nucleic acid ligase n=1 Tax=Acidicapsa dinghuensis TaxID=2218256 RepID=A0ABW1EA07_9BACT|nr:RtcB family protein [Acidicapsa dinghuensis]